MYIYFSFTLAYQTIITLVLVNSTLNENDGLVPHAAYIEVEGSVESTVTVSLSVTPLGKVLLQISMHACTCVVLVLLLKWSCL